MSLKYTNNVCLIGIHSSSPQSRIQKSWWHSYFGNHPLFLYPFVIDSLECFLEAVNLMSHLTTMFIIPFDTNLHTSLFSTKKNSCKSPTIIFEMILFLFQKPFESSQPICLLFDEDFYIFEQGRQGDTVLARGSPRRRGCFFKWDNKIAFMIMEGNLGAIPIC